MKSSILLILSLVLASASVYGLGITGALKTSETYVPSAEVPFSYTITANKEHAIGYSMFAHLDADLKKNVFFDQKRFEQVPAGNSFKMSGVIRLPESLDPPGWHEVQICVEEDCPTPGMVCGKAVVCGRKLFYVLYPGKYPVLNFMVNNIKENQPLKLEATIKNDGKDNIEKATGKVHIYNFEEKIIGTVDFEPQPIPSEESASFSAEFDTIGVSPGNYSAEAVFDVDGKELKDKKTFRIGTLNVMILGHDAELKKGGIKPFKVTVQSDWGDPLKVEADVTLKDDGATVIKGKTVTGILEPWKTLDLEAFIDTSNLEEKEYDTEIVAYYAEKTSTFSGKIKVLLDSSIEPAEETPEKDSGSLTLTLSLIAVVLVLTIINIILAIRRKKK